MLTDTIKRYTVILFFCLTAISSGYFLIPKTSLFNSIVAEYYIDNNEYSLAEPYLYKAVIFSDNYEEKLKLYNKSMIVFSLTDNERKSVTLSQHMTKQKQLTPRANIYIASYYLSKDYTSLNNVREAKLFIEPIKDIVPNMYDDIINAEHELITNSRITNLTTQTKRDIENQLIEAIIPSNPLELIPALKGAKLFTKVSKAARLANSLNKIPPKSYGFINKLSNKFNGKSNYLKSRESSIKLLDEYKKCKKKSQTNCEEILDTQIIMN